MSWQLDNIMGTQLEEVWRLASLECILVLGLEHQILPTTFKVGTLAMEVGYRVLLYIDGICFIYWVNIPSFPIIPR